MTVPQNPHPLPKAFKANIRMHSECCVSGVHTDATSSWDEDTQKWELGDVNGDDHCNECGDACKVVYTAIDGPHSGKLVDYHHHTELTHDGPFVLLDDWHMLESRRKWVLRRLIAKRTVTSDLELTESLVPVDEEPRAYRAAISGHIAGSLGTIAETVDQADTWRVVVMEIGRFSGKPIRIVDSFKDLVSLDAALKVARGCEEILSPASESWTVNVWPNNG